VRRLGQDANVVANDLAQDFVERCNIALASNVVTKFGLEETTETHPDR
jgi:hypothetical protein